MGKYKHIVVK